MSQTARSENRTLVIGCGALVREVTEITTRHGLGIDVEYLPAILHNRPELIPDAVDERLKRASDKYDSVFVAYADCGTGGLLDQVLERHGVARLDGPHCYQFFAGESEFSALTADEPGTFFLTDFLARHFHRLVWQGLGMADHPELLEMYFGNYTRLVFLSQTSNPDLTALAEKAADRLGLKFEHRHVGFGELEPALVRIAPTRMEGLAS